MLLSNNHHLLWKVLVYNFNCMMCLFPATPAHSLASQPIPTAQSVSSSPSVPVEEPALVVELSEIPDGTLGKSIPISISQ